MTRDRRIESEGGLLLEHIDLIESHSFLGDQDLLRTLDDEVSSGIIWAFSYPVKDLLREFMEETEVGSDHKGDLPVS